LLLLVGLRRSSWEGGDWREKEREERRSSKERVELEDEREQVT